MQIADISIQKLKSAPWNSNQMNPRMMAHLQQSIEQYGLVENMVVRPLATDMYEVIGGNWRLKVLSKMGFQEVPCMIVDLDDANARLLAQALNRIEGEDDIKLKAELMKQVLASIPQEEVLSLLPETAESLQSLASLGEMDMAAYLQNWQKAQSARLNHLQFQLTTSQLQVVQDALKDIMRRIKPDKENPNERGAALYHLCREYLDLKGGK